MLLVSKWVGAFVKIICMYIYLTEKGRHRNLRKKLTDHFNEIMLAPPFIILDKAFI